MIGLFLFGIAAGVVAFIMAGRAEAAGVKATAGKVLGVLGIVGGIVVMVMFLQRQHAVGAVMLSYHWKVHLWVRKPGASSS